MLVARENGFDSQNNFAISSKSTLLNQRCGVALGGRQSVVVSDENDVSRIDSGLNLLGIEYRLVVTICFVEFTQVFAAVVRILGADFALHSRQRVQLRGAAAGSKISDAGHWCFS